ncbi:MAG: SpoIIE family protein phosphatase, partial [Bacteroidia bacterium]|nr:SpoIIE family protein phosphatase [Bacteroidia bacterium]
ALYYQGSYDQATSLLNRAESLLTRIPPDTGIIVQILNLKAFLAENRGDNLEAKSLYEKAYSLAQQSGNPRLMIITLINQAELYRRIQLHELAEETILQALTLAEKTREVEYQRNALKTLSALRIQQGRVEEALVFQKRILDIARETGIREWLKDAYGFIITQAAHKGLPQVDSLLHQAEKELSNDSLLWAELLNWIAAEGFYPVGSLARAKDLYQTALTIAEARGEPTLAIRTLLNLANIYTRQALYPQAMEHLLRARRLCEDRKDSTLLPMVTMALGEIYFSQDNWTKALEAFTEAAYYANLAPDPAFPFKVSTNLAAVQAKLGNVEAARNLFRESKLLAEESEDWRSAANACINLARLDLDQGLTDSALTDLALAQKYAEKSRDPYTLANVHMSRGEILSNRKLFSQAIQQYEIARKLLEPLEAYSELAEVYEKLIRLYGQLRAYDKAFALFFPLLEATQRLSNEESIRALTRMELDYLHQKEKDAQERQIEAEKLRAEKARQITWVIISSAALILAAAAIVLIVLYRANRREKEINAELAERNRLIEEQKTLLEEKNEALERAKRDIEESILYARRIQLAILPDLQPFYERFPESFVLYLPRDVVSGDFYYFHPLSPHQSLLAVADCTGHGVPGAFMSMIGSTLLNRIAQEEGPKDPAFLLQRLDEELRVTLHHTMTQDKIKDGMDIGLCLIDTETHELHFAGARRPLLVISPEGELIELKASRRSIGGDLLQQEFPFEGHSLPLRAGTSFFLFSDGIVDQFGWEKEPGKEPRRTKFMQRRLRQLLQRIHSLPASQQREAIEDTYHKWRGDIEQIDDICIIGVRYT